MPTGIYHITHLDNLASMIAKGALLAISKLREGQSEYSTIAHQSIQDQRSSTAVPCGPGGVLHDFVPFYFAPRSPMLCAISNGRVASCPNQEDVVHLVSAAEVILDAGLGFAFTDGHAIMAWTEFYDDLADLDKVDWPLMKATYWRDTLDDMDRKRRRQAEFLVHESTPWEWIAEIVVMQKSVEDKVRKIVMREGDTTPVRTRRSWYY